MDLRNCVFRGVTYPVRYEIWGDINSFFNNEPLFTRYQIFQIGFSSLVLINHLGPPVPTIHGSPDGDIQVYELTDINLLTTLNHTLRRHEINMFDRMIYNVSVQISAQNIVTVQAWLSSGQNARQHVNNVLWVSADQNNPGFQDDSVPEQN